MGKQSSRLGDGAAVRFIQVGRAHLGPCRNYVGETGVIDPTSATLSISTRSSA
jgi:hypothetical protein